MASPSNSEQDEVRELLSQHRDGIARELRTSRMMAVLLDTDVLTAKDRLAICGDDDTTTLNGAGRGGGSGRNSSSPAIDVDSQCTNLIDYVAQHGFEKFKQFCYAIEAECPQLIADLINDRLKYDNDEKENFDRNDGAPTNGKEIIIDEANTKEIIQSDHSRRSSSHTNDFHPQSSPSPHQHQSPHRPPASTTPTAGGSTSRVSTPRMTPRSPLPIPTGAMYGNNDSVNQYFANAIRAKSQQPLGGGAYPITPPPRNQPQPSYHQFPATAANYGLAPTVDSNYAPLYANKINFAGYTSNLNATSKAASRSSSLLCHQGTGTDSPLMSAKRRDNNKLAYRYSDASTWDIKASKNKKNRRNYHSMSETIETLADTVVEDADLMPGDRTSWEYHTVSVTRVSGYGFGIAVSGGRDNPHFANGDPSIAVSDVLKGGPAEERLQVNDRIISVNGVSLENVEYATAVQVLRDSGNTVTLMVKRRVPHMGMNMMSANLPASMAPGVGGGHHHQLSGGAQPSAIGGQPPIGAYGPIGSSQQHQIIMQQQHQQQQQQQHQQQQQQQYLKCVLSKTSKKEDFGIVLGCRLFVKEISAKARDQLALNGYTLQEGDIITRLHNTNTNEMMSLKEARKIMDGCKERLNLAVLRDIVTVSGGPPQVALPPTPQSPVYSHTAQPSNCSNLGDEASFFGRTGGVAGVNVNGGGGGVSGDMNNSYSAQNLYVQPPTRPSGGPMSLDDKSNLTPRGRSRNPLMDVSLLQLDRPSTPRDLPPAPPGDSDMEPPRPPPPREEDFYASRRQLYEEDPLRRAKQSAEPRFISFQKEGSVGIRLTGGNEAGIFVTAVQPGSPASLQGLTPGDKILKVNDMDMAGVTREEAVLFLLSLQDRIDLIVQHCREEYDQAVANQRGDSFHIKTHFHCENPTKGEMSFKAGDIFRVVDTLHNGVVGAWQVLRIGRGQQEIQRGVIPNKARAEELATAQFNAHKKEANSSESRTSFFRRRRPTHRRSKSLSRENWDDVIFSDSSISKFPAYERVVLRHPGFVRPVVMFGPVADLARERLIKDFPDKFTAPAQGVHHTDDTDDGDKSGTKCGIVRLSNIRDIMDRGKHALLDITPNAVDRLNYAQFYPIVVFLKADNKHQIKQLRQGIPKSVHKSSKKLFDQCQKLDRVWSHVFSGVLMLNDADTWYRKLRDTIDQLQSGAIWMSENKPVESLSDDFLFPMNTTSRLSYASSPESDLEMSPGPSTSLSLGNLPQLVKSSSDPSIATNQDLLERDRELAGKLDEAQPLPYTTNGRPAAIGIVTESKYGFTGDDHKASAIDPTKTGSHHQHLQHHQHQHPQQAGFYGKVPELPPRIDRASKPPGGYPTSPPPPVAGARPPMSPDPTSGTFRRTTAQDRLFGSRQAMSMAGHDGNEMTVDNDYAPGDPSHNSLDRSANNTNAGLLSPGKRSVGGGQSLHSNGTFPPPPVPSAVAGANGSYDSVSSYESCNTTQLTQMQQRLGPNAPDDLKSVPAASLTSRLNELMINPAHNSNGSGLPDAAAHLQHSHSQQQQQHLSKRPSMHEHSRSMSNGRQSSPGRPPFVGGVPGGPAGGPVQQAGAMHPGLSIMHRPNHLGLDMAAATSSPPTKKPHPQAPGGVETKTDYGKYSRNNSATQADYAMRTPGSPQIGGSGGAVVGNGVPFKPVPPPKPKNYHPPVQRNQMGNGYWENGAPMEPSSPRSPNGFYYPPAPSHYHHNQNAVGSNGGHMPPPPPQQHHQQQQPQHPPKHGGGQQYGQYGAHQQPQHYNGGHHPQQQQQQQQQQSPSYGYHGAAPADYQAHHRPPGMGKSVPPLPPGNHPSERNALDLAGSREQRGSAFELYRKPQIGSVGHHHNMSDMESTSSANSAPQQFRFANGSMDSGGGYPPEDPYYQQHTNQQHQHQQHYQQHDADPNQPDYMPQRPTQRHPQQYHRHRAAEYPPQHHHHHDDGTATHAPPLPPPLKPKKKMSMLRSPFNALKKAFSKSTKPLRRQNSMIDGQSADKPRVQPAVGGGLRRQHSMLEPSRPNHFAGTPDMSGQRRRHYYSEDRGAGGMYGRVGEPHYMTRHEAFRPGDNGMYQSQHSEAIYGNCGQQQATAAYYDQHQDESLYANRNAVAFERTAASQPPPEVGATGRRIVRRHSMADRHNDPHRMARGRSEPRTTTTTTAGGRYDVPPPPQQAGSSRGRYDVPPPPERVDDEDGAAGGGDGDIYQTRSGAYMMDTVVAARRQQQQQQHEQEAIYQSRREMHRDHLYQSRAEMQQRIQQGREDAAEQHHQHQPHRQPSSMPTTPVGDGDLLSPIYGTRSEALAAAGSQSSASTGSQSPSGGGSVIAKDGTVVYQSRRELKERGFKTRTQLRDHIYQSRREAMQSMAEPLYVSRREMRHEPIYEARESQCFDDRVRVDGGGLTEEEETDNNHATGEHQNDLSLKAVIDHLDNGFIESQQHRQHANETMDETMDDTMADEDDMDETNGEQHEDDDDDDDDPTLTNQNANQSDLQKTVLAATPASPASSHPAPPMTPRSARDPFHISNMIKRTAPAPSPTSSQPSIVDNFIVPSIPAEMQAQRLQQHQQQHQQHMLHPHASRTSIETQFTCNTANGASMISLPTGPPNAQSTPYASQMQLPMATTAASASYPPLREQTTMRGTFDAAGGTLSDTVWNVSISIPPGAIAAGVQQEIYFTVTDPRMSQVVGGPPLDMENGETMLSPLVMCGPQGIEFLRPVTLNIPHCAGRTASLGLALKATDSETNQRTNWDNIDLPSTAAAHTVSVQVDHF